MSGIINPHGISKFRGTGRCPSGSPGDGFGIRVGSGDKWGILPHGASNRSRDKMGEKYRTREQIALCAHLSPVVRQELRDAFCIGAAPPLDEILASKRRHRGAPRDRIKVSVDSKLIWGCAI